jgi:ubiquinone/menaquinone biosynthesis C-methylase UbiE
LKKNNEYLISGFATVDSNEEQTVYVNCLNYIDTIPYFKEIKAKTYELLDLEYAHALLEIGCGIGNDIYRIASLVSKKSTIIGIDRSTFMIEKAQSSRLFKYHKNIEFKVADGRELPYKNDSFNRCRIDRTLQHIENPQKVVNEAYRVLKTNGIFVAYDNDWSSFSFSLKDERLSRIIENYYCDTFVNGKIGCYLKAYFSVSGFKDITLYPSTLILNDFEVADKIYDISMTVNKALLDGLLTPIEAKNIINDCKVQTINSEFHCALTSYTIMGIKP